MSIFITLGLLFVCVWFQLRVSLLSTKLRIFLQTLKKVHLFYRFLFESGNVLGLIQVEFKTKKLKRVRTHVAKYTYLSSSGTAVKNTVDEKALSSRFKEVSRTLYVPFMK